MRISSSVRSRSVRAGTKVAAAVAMTGAALSAGAPAAFALGESGDIDIRSVSWHSRGDRNGVEVCQFVLVANNFGELPQLVWTITERPPGNTLTNTLPLVDGKARSQEYLLPEGTYTLSWTAGPLKQEELRGRLLPARAGGRPGRQPRGGRGPGFVRVRCRGEQERQGRRRDLRQAVRCGPRGWRRCPRHGGRQLGERVERRCLGRPGRRCRGHRGADHGPSIRTPSCPQRGMTRAADVDGGVRAVHAGSR